MHRLILLLILCLSLQACTAKTGGSVTLTSLESKQTFTQPFPRAYLSKTSIGDFHIVLLDNVIGDAEQKAGAISPTSIPPTRQVIHIHVLWRPLGATRADSPSATNAAVDWYIMGVGTERTQDILLYQGAGFITIYGSGATRTVTLRNTTLRPTQSAGDMTDHLGPTLIEGSIICTLDDGRVQSILADTRDAAAALQHSAAR